MFYNILKRHIGGEGRAHETGIPPTPSRSAGRPCPAATGVERTNLALEIRQR